MRTLRRIGPALPTAPTPSHRRFPTYPKMLGTIRLPMAPYRPRAVAPAFTSRNPAGRPEPACPPTANATSRISRSLHPPITTGIWSAPRTAPTARSSTGAGGSFPVVGGTSVAAPTFAAILALINESLGNSPPSGLGNVNPNLYTFAGSNPSAFHDVTTGNNIVPCTSGTPNCPATAPFQFGFSAGTGYDQVTGLGSVDADKLAIAWAASITRFLTSATPLTPASVSAGNSVTSTVTITPQNGFSGTVTLGCTGLPPGATCTFNPSTIAGGSGTTQLMVQTQPNTAAATTTVTVMGTSGVASNSTPVSLVVTVTAETFSLTSNLTGGTLSVAQGATSDPVNLTVTSST